MTDKQTAPKARHSPGPWSAEVHELSEGFTGCVYDANGHRLVDYLSEADANLIAAAPKLLQALKSTRAVAALHMKARGFSGASIAEAFPQADAAIAAAEGRDNG